MSDRNVDFSLAGSQRGINDQQRKYLKAHLKRDLLQTINIRQVHGNNILLIDESYQQTGNLLPEADGLVTGLSEVALVVRTADCLPIFIYDPRHEIIGLVHAGWRGSQKKIVEKAVALMKRHFHTKTGNIKVAFGPCMRSCCYEIKQDVAQYFPQEIIEKGSKIFLDLPNVNRNQLLRVGVDKANILDSQECTCCHEDYFSYRREGKRTGRMLSLIMLESKT